MDQARACKLPFKHWVVDNAISPGLLTAINRDWPADDDWRWRKEDGRFSKKWAMAANFGAPGRLVSQLNTPTFCARIAELIGEREVVPDPEQFGGGLHAIPPGGFLGMHQDFKHRPDGFKRVANLLLYVNLRWQDEWGGALQLGLGDRAVSYAPIGGRAVLFRTDVSDSWHGHPTPMPCPDDVMRRSVAVYYYTRDTGTPDTTRYRK